MDPDRNVLRLPGADFTINDVPNEYRNSLVFPR